MPLRCKDAAGQDLHAFRLSEIEWTALREANAAQEHLVMPCCGEKVVLKTSVLGTQFFAHRRKGPCVTKPETAEHLMLKNRMALAIEACGWDVATEVRGSSPEGDDWVADILATRGTAKLAVEIQWSPQKDEVTIARQERYARSGVRCLWIFRQESFISSSSVPAVRVELEDGEFSISTYRGEACSPGRGERTVKIRTRAHCSPEEFASKAFAERKFWFGVMREGDTATVQLLGAKIRCWRCSEYTTALVQLVMWTDTSITTHDCLLDESAKVPDLINQLDRARLATRQVGGIAKRYSKTENGYYLANGCFHCNALQGKHFLHPHRVHLVDLGNHTIRITPALEKWLSENAGAQWHVDP